MEIFPMSLFYVRKIETRNPTPKEKKYIFLALYNRAGLSGNSQVSSTGWGLQILFIAPADFDLFGFGLGDSSLPTYGFIYLSTIHLWLIWP